MNFDQSTLTTVVNSLTVISTIMYVISAIAGWKVFTKAGQPGWKSLIPVYNLYVQYSFTWVSYYAFITVGLQFVGNLIGALVTGPLALLGTVLSLVGFVFSVIGNNKLSKAFGHGAGFTVGLVLLNPIFLLILGFGSSEYIGKDGAADNQ